MGEDDARRVVSHRSLEDIGGAYGGGAEAALVYLRDGHQLVYGVEPMYPH